MSTVVVHGLSKKHTLFSSAGDNFATDAITEDNIIFQARAANKRFALTLPSFQAAVFHMAIRSLVFMGDDTWMMLFPNEQPVAPGDASVTHDAASQFTSGYWTEAFPFESFNVKDLHSVDEGVMRHLLPTVVNGTSPVRARRDKLTRQAAECRCSPQLATPPPAAAAVEAGSAGGTPPVPEAQNRPSDSKRHESCDCSRLRAALAELREPSSLGWDVVVAHFLGVDHVGHTHGPTHPAMQSKLHQMDNMLADLAAALPDDSLLVVMGDHGMTAQGNHGGNTAEEVTAALMLVSKQPLSADMVHKPPSGAGTTAYSSLADHSGGYLGALRARLGLLHSLDAVSSKARQEAEPVARVKQVDIVPTLSTLLGLPIPFGNLGRLMPDLQYGDKPQGGAPRHLDALLQGLQLNAAQIMRFIRTYEKTSSDFSASAVDSLQRQLEVASRLASHTGGVEAQLEAIGAYAQFLQSAFEECRAVWAQFDVPSMLVGVALTWLVALALFRAAVPQDTGMPLRTLLWVTASALTLVFVLDAMAVSSLLRSVLGALRDALSKCSTLPWPVSTVCGTAAPCVGTLHSTATGLRNMTSLWLNEHCPAGVLPESRFSSTAALLHLSGAGSASRGAAHFLTVGAGELQPLADAVAASIAAICLRVPEAVCGWPAEVLSSLVLFDESSTQRDAAQPDAVLTASGLFAGEGSSLPGGHVRSTGGPAFTPNVFGALGLAAAVAWGLQRLLGSLSHKPAAGQVGAAVLPYGNARVEESISAPQVRHSRSALPLAAAARRRLPQLCAIVVFFRCVALFGNSGIEAELEVLTFLVATVQLAWIVSALVHKAWAGAAWLAVGLVLVRVASEYGKLLLGATAPPQHTPVWEHFEGALGPVGVRFAPWLLCILPGTAMTTAALMVPLTCNVCGARGVSTRHAGASFGRGLNGVLNAVAGLLALVAWVSALQYWAATASSFPHSFIVALDPTLPPAATANGWVAVACTAVIIGVSIMAVAIFLLPVLPCCKPRHGGRFPAAATDDELEAAMKPSIPCENRLFALTSCALALPLLALLLGPGSVPALLLLGFAAASTAGGGWTTVLYQAHAATMDGVPRGTAMARALWPASVIMALAGPFAFHATGHATKLSALQYSAAFVGFETFDFWRSGVALALNTAGGHIMVALAAGPLLPARTWRSLRVAGVLQTQASFVHLLALACTVTWLVLSRRHLMVWAIFAPKFIFELFFLLLWVLGVAAWLACGRPGGQSKRRPSPNAGHHEHTD